MARPDVEIDFEVFAHEGEHAIGAVREIHPDHLIVWIENRGDTRIDAEHVAGAHDGKVVLVEHGLPDALNEAIAHAHDAESRGPSAGVSSPDGDRTDDGPAYGARDEEE